MCRHGTVTCVEYVCLYGDGTDGHSHAPVMGLDTRRIRLLPTHYRYIPLFRREE